jgi:hypothetical protein
MVATTTCVGNLTEMLVDKRRDDGAAESKAVERLDSLKVIYLLYI